ncbi:hypothetical protein BDY21DRAFT_353380 [Lineolata rhizophorae]|uniref:Uncharacterized protein n=1 Tax=Lineolata rhizophorae TaxID=578093 RepID=A0A6A6NR29_9PEZI|nr:hypothetical protein BDY21DRAFT_353380 [Lineolata rhizophorae]
MKMNQSLKRCLGWTEELIKDGRKALEYRVRVSDVKLGGRVLRDEEDEDEGGHRSGEGGEGALSPGRGGSLLGPWTPVEEGVKTLEEKADGAGGEEKEETLAEEVSAIAEALEDIKVFDMREKGSIGETF